MPTYNYVITSLKKTGPCGHVYICNVNLFWFFPPPPPPCQAETAAFSSVPFKGCSNFHLQFQKERKKKKEKKKKMYRVVSCRVANARVGYRIKCL